MSYSHPYLKQLKAHILSFCQSNVPIKDDNEAVLPFFRTLEDILRLGLTSYCVQSSDGRRSYWPLIKSLSLLYPTHKLTAPLQFCIEHTDKCNKVVENRGKERLFLRCAANKGTLALAFRLAKEKRDVLSLYYNDSSILGDEILSELFISMLVPLTQCAFTLNYKNAAFLDETWQLPLYKKYELVPCRKLGICLECGSNQFSMLHSVKRRQSFMFCRAVNGRLVVLDIEPSSVADEDAKIECGDIIDEIFGESMRNSSKRKFMSLMSEYQGSPIYISVIKCINHDDIFEPILPFLEQLQLCKRALLENHKRRMQEAKTVEIFASSTGNTSNVEQQTGPICKKIVNEKGYYPVKFCGLIYVGTIGSVEQIESGVWDVLKKDEPKRDVYLDLGETDIVVLCSNTQKIILQHGYPEIASCGRRIDYPLNFSYIAGETTCTLAKKFICYVFEASCEEQARIILKEVAKGFDRTHWAV